jgi:hypothetical protein
MKFWALILLAALCIGCEVRTRVAGSGDSDSAPKAKPPLLDLPNVKVIEGFNLRCVLVEDAAISCGGPSWVYDGDWREVPVDEHDYLP